MWVQILVNVKFLRADMTQLGITGRNWALSTKIMFTDWLYL